MRGLSLSFPWNFGDVFSCLGKETLIIPLTTICLTMEDARERRQDALSQLIVSNYRTVYRTVQNTQNSANLCIPFSFRRIHSVLQETQTPDSRGQRTTLTASKGLRMIIQERKISEMHVKVEGERSSAKKRRTDSLFSGTQVNYFSLRFLLPVCNTCHPVCCVCVLLGE